jgi:hypothetical protein
MEPNKLTDPPKWALRLFRLICHRDFAEEIEGDLLEKYNHDLQKFGFDIARKQIWLQLLSIVKLNLIFNLNQNKMKSIFNFIKNPLGMLFVTALGLFAARFIASLAHFSFENSFMFSVPQSTILLFIPMLLLSLWSLYLLTTKILFSGKLTRTHIVITVVTTLLIVALSYAGGKPSPITIRNYELVGGAIQLLCITCIAGQFIFIANILTGLIHNISKRNRQTV